MSINFPAFITSLRFMVEGWLGIFIVMGVIIAVIYGLNKVSDMIEEKQNKKNA